tara:strand:+ start:8115 stop:8321 length:207 start_codon:yes stop_codon:yes gene_type:complete
MRDCKTFKYNKQESGIIEVVHQAKIVALVGGSPALLLWVCDVDDITLKNVVKLGDIVIKKFKTTNIYK